MELKKRILDLLNNEDVSIKISNTTNVEALYEIMAPSLPDVSKEDFVSTLKTMTAEGLDAKDEDLEEVAGGKIQVATIDLIRDDEEIH